MFKSKPKKLNKQQSVDVLKKNDDESSKNLSEPVVDPKK